MMISYNEALQIVQTTAQGVNPMVEDVPLIDAPGRACAREITAGLDIQPFDNSAMDGFSLHRDDLNKAHGKAPLRLKKAGIIAAGQDASAVTQEPGTCWHIMTGAMLPAGAAAVVPVEDVMMEGEMVSFAKEPTHGQHIRAKGEDFKKGSILLRAGEKVGAAHILPLATLGVGAVPVFKKPRITFIPTGAEIVDRLGAPLGHGQIYNSNGYYALSFLSALGAAVTLNNTLPDDCGKFLETLAALQGARQDIIVSSGAVSAGSFDFVRDGLEEAGAKILYHKMKLKPGKPNLLAVLPSGALYFGLPGNPVATAVGLRFFVAAALRVIMQQGAEKPVFLRANNGFTKKNSLTMILKARREYHADGTVFVHILDGQESFKVSPFLQMDCWVHVPEAVESVVPGDMVAVYPFLP